jgi:DNA-binding GntR family transcriptional regulator
MQVIYRGRMADDLNRDSPVPLFEQLAALLKAEIDAGKITVRLPSEIALTQEYGVSRGTAHRAVMILVDAGYARISRGKGTFVVPKAQR